MLFFYGVLVIIACIVVIVAINTIRFKSISDNSNYTNSGVEFDFSSCRNKLSKAIQLKTISHDDYDLTDWDEFHKFREFLLEEFPLVHENMELEIINGYSLLYRWKGKNSQEKPILVTAHMDVVPVEEGTERDWEQEAFSGVMKDGYLWGRGALDTKIHMISSLEAAEQGIEKGFIPNRDIYFAFGHDEEVGGLEGAQKIVEHLIDKGIQFEYLLDEGGTVIEGLIDDIDKPIALIGIGEKGYANIKISVAGDGGHSSMPPKHTALGTLAKVINNIENKQTKLVLTPAIKEFLMRLGPEMKLINRIVLSNLWLFEPLFLRMFANTKSGNAMLRTTTAVTMAEASMAPNVLPQNASVVCNFRLIPGDTCDKLIQHLRDVNKDIDLKIDGLRLENPSSISPTDTLGFKAIERNIKKIYSEAIVTPYVVLAGTDARKYEPVCDNIYRFTPYFIDNNELGSIHSTNERISMENIDRCLEFFGLLFRNIT